MSTMMTSYFPPTRRLNRIHSHRGEWAWFDEGVITTIVHMITTPRVCLALLITFSQLNRQCRDAVDRWFEATLSKLGRLAADLRREFRNTYRISNGISHGYLEKLVREHVRETPTYIAYKKALLAVFDAQTVSSFLLGSFMSFGHFTTDGRRELMSVHVVSRFVALETGDVRCPPRRRASAAAP